MASDDRLLEREAELEALGRLLSDAAAGRGGTALVGGEAGAGKSALVAHLRRLAPPGTRQYVGRCDPLSMPRPLGPLLDILAADRGRGAGEDAAGPSTALFDTFLARIADGRGPALVVFEDLHWADEATLDLLRFLGRRLGTLRVLMVATYRDEDLGPDHPLRIAMGDLATVRSVHRLSVSPLSISGVEVLAAGTDLDPATLYRLTGGNPFFVTEVIAAHGTGVPPTVADAVMARAARLSPAGRSALEAAAVVGARAEPWLVARLVETAGGVEDGIDECIRGGMLRDEEDALVFRHELARQAVLAAISPRRRVQLHQRVLGQLRGVTAGVDALARLAHHADAAGDAEAVLAFAPDAARHAARLGAHREAAAQYARALRFGGGLAATARAELLDGHAYECYLTGRLADAIESRRAALGTWRQLGDRLREGDGLRHLSRLYWFSGMNDAARRAAREALEVLETERPGRELAFAYSNLAQLHMLEQDDALAVRWGKRAIALAERLGETEVLAHALNNVGGALLAQDDEQGFAKLEASLALARQAGLEEHAARAYTNLGSRSVKLYRLDLAERYLQEGIAYCAEHDLDSWRLYMLGDQARALVLRGRWSEATEVAVAILRHPRASSLSRITALVALARVRARRGDPEVGPLLDEALELASPTGELQRLGPVRAARAEAAWLAGDRARTAAEASAAYALARDRRDAELVGELATWLRRADVLASPPDGAFGPFASWLAGRRLEAAQTWRGLGCPYEEAQALAESGEIAAMRSALVAFERLGARPASARTAGALRSLGVHGVPRGPRGATRADPDGLTSREAEVRVLIVQGMRNGEIAAHLSLSPKTVEHHISAILRKLGGKSREDVVRDSLERGPNGET